MLRFSDGEAAILISQIVISKTGRGGSRHLPFIFTEQGVAMLSSVLKSERAIDVNIMIMRAFVRLRQLVSLNRALAKRLAAIERKLTGHDAMPFHKLAPCLAARCAASLSTYQGDEPIPADGRHRVPAGP